MSAIRRDVYISNDSGGYSVIPSSALDRIIADERNNDHAIVSDHQALLLMLHGDDSFPCRMVANGPLTADEDAEWLARASWRLTVPCGKVLLCGGYDPDVLADWHEGDHVFQNAVHAIDVPPGEYLVDIYTHRPTISGRFLDSSWPTPLGAWYRAEHPGQPFPNWMGNELKLSPELDPGHEKDWEDVKRAVAQGRLSIDPNESLVIGYLVHLRPFTADAVLSPLPEDGWFEPETGARVPARCPLGLPTDISEPDF